MTASEPASDPAMRVRQRARAFWVRQSGVGAIEPAEVDAPRDGDVLVETSFSAVSRGTESLVFTGRVPPAMHERMRGPRQEGAFTFPIKYGYSAVGSVVAGVGVGRRVFCLHPHQTAFCVPDDAVVELPDDVPEARAVLGALMETALTAVWDARVSPGDRVAVVGAGTVGCLTARIVATMPGCTVQLVDTDPGKASVAAVMGASFATPDTAEGAADVVFHASGSPAGLQSAIDLAGVEAAVVELSWFGDRSVTLQLGGAFHPDRLRLCSSQVGSIPAHQSPRWTHRRRLQVALSLLADDALDALFAHDTPFDALPELMVALASPTPPPLVHRIRYR